MGVEDRLDGPPALQLERLAALLIDLDGVLYVGDEPIAGAVAAVARLAASHLALRFITNTTTRPRAALLAKLERLGFRVAPEHLFTPAALARRAMERQDGPGVRYRLLAAPQLAEDLGPGHLGPDDPGAAAWVVLGLHPPLLNHRALSVGLADLLGGARLLALHVNRTYKTPRGLELGLGAYVQALSYASGVEPRVVGKPSAAFFEEALADLGVAPGEVAMVGDGVESDVGGAQAVGVPGVLVRTGKYSARALAQSGVEPALIVADIGALAARLAPR